jgi:hypothetical protein
MPSAPSKAYKLPKGIDVSQPFNTDEHRRRLAEDGGRLTSDSISRELRELIFLSLNIIDPVRYLCWLATEHPAIYALYVTKSLIRDDESRLAGLTIVVEQVTAEPQATPGVICSPEARDVSLTNRPTHLKLIERIETLEAEGTETPDTV